MVFESIFVSLINKYLSEFIDDLSVSQFKLGALKGDVVVKNLAVKPNAFDSLNLPFRVVHGHIGHLSLKIPWMSIYTSPVRVFLSDILVIAVPNVDSEYNEEYEKEQENAEKKRQLQKYEDSIRKAATKVAETDEESTDDFTTKLVSQIIKNLQITVLRVHVRIEDKFSNPSSPIAVGFTLNSLDFLTIDAETDGPGKKYLPKHPENFIYKSVSLKQLSFYWNCYTPRTMQDDFFSEVDEDIRDELMANCIASDTHWPKHLAYILQPSNFFANSVINRKPHLERFSIPALDLETIIETFDLCFGRTQFSSLITLLDSIERMDLAFPYRKWRPRVSLNGHPSIWWKYAMTVVLETRIRRANREWSWSYMRDHRRRFKEYVRFYALYLLGDKTDADGVSVSDRIQELEAVLDVFNIILARSEAEVRYIEEKKSRSLAGTEQKAQAGWFGGWFSWSSSTDKQEAEKKKELEIVSQFKSEMTPEEKMKLYQAIGYEEKNESTDFPIDFVAHEAILTLKSFSISITDLDDLAARFVLSNMSIDVRHRPSGKAFQATTKIASLGFLGTGGNELISHASDCRDLFTVSFESNPLDKSFDYGIGVTATTTTFTFDATTVNSLQDIFIPPRDVALQDLQALAAIKMSEFKDMSSTGLEYVIDKHQRFKVSLDVEPSFLVIPDEGNLRDPACQNVLLVCLGQLKLESDLIDKHEVANIRSAIAAESSTQLIDVLREKAYEKYNLRVSNVAAILSNINDWKTDMKKASETVAITDSHLLQPVETSLLLKRCIITDDAKMSKLIVSGELPKVTVSASNEQIVRLAKLFASIPFASSSSENIAKQRFDESDAVIKAKKSDDAMKLAKKRLAEAKQKARDERDSMTKVKELTDLELRFKVGLLSVELFGDQRSKLLTFAASALDVEMLMRTFSITANVSLSDMAMNGRLRFIETVKNKDECSLQFSYRLIDKSSILFESVVQQLHLRVSEFALHVNPEMVRELLGWSASITDNLPKDSASAPQQTSITRTSSVSSLAEISDAWTKSRPKSGLRRKMKKVKDADFIDLQLLLDIRKVYVHLDDVAEISLGGLKSDFKVHVSNKMVFDACWTEFQVANCFLSNQKRLVHESIVKSEGDQVLNLGVIIFPKKKKARKLQNHVDLDMDVKVEFGKLRVTFLNEFISRLLDFLTVFESAKATAIQAATDVTDYAKKSAMSAYESSSKIGLNVSLEAPSIIIPKSWESDDGLLFELGSMKLSNRFHMDSGATLEFIKLDLSNTKIAVLGSELNDILAPISFGLKVTRNLDFAVNKGSPEVNVSAIFEKIKLQLSQSDIVLMLKVLKENITASAKEAEPEIISESEKVKEVIAEVEANPTINTITEEAVVHAEDGKDQAVQETFTKFKFHFTLSKLELALFDGPVKIIEKQLSLLVFSEFNVSGSIKTNEDIAVSIGMTDVDLFDTRFHRNEQGIRKLLYKRKTLDRQDSDSHADRSKIMKVDIAMSKDVDLDVRLSGFTLIVALDYLLNLSTIFTSALSEAQPVIEDKIVEGKDQFKAAAGKKIKESIETTKKTDALTVINFKMSRADIILIENIDSTDSPVLIMNAVAMLALKQKGIQLSICGSLKRVQLAIVNFDRYQRDTNSVDAYILKPTQLFIQAAFSGENAAHFDLNMNPMNISVSPNTVQVLTSILSSLGKSSSDEKTLSTSDQHKKRIMSASKLFTQKSLDKALKKPEKYWFLQPKLSLAAEVTEDLSLSSLSLSGRASPTDSGSPFQSNQQVMLTIKSITILIESGGLDSHPLLKLDSSLNARLDNWAHLDATIELQIGYYNDLQHAWEPLVEPARDHRSWSFALITDLRQTSNGSTKLSAKLKAHETLEITVSKAFLGVLFTLQDVFAKAVKRSESLMKDQNILVLKNHLGYDMVMHLSPSKFRVAGHKKKRDDEGVLDNQTLKHGESLTLKCLVTETEKESDDDVLFIKMSMNIGERLFEQDVYLGSRKKRCYELIDRKKKTTNWMYVIDQSEWSAISKVVNFHSTVELVNKFDLPLAVWRVTNEKKTQSLGTIEPSAKFYLPVYIVYSKDPKIFVTPTNGDYELSNACLDWNTTATCHELICRHKNGKDKFYLHYSASSESLLYEKTSVTTNASTSVCIELRPQAYLRNLLPYSVKVGIVSTSAEWILPAGDERSLDATDIDSMHLCIRLKYFGDEWTSKQPLNSKKWSDGGEENVELWSFASSSNPSKPALNLAFRYNQSDENGNRSVWLFAPFWIFNRTDLGMAYSYEKGHQVNHEANQKDALLFCFKTIYSKKKLCLAIEDSMWSDDFSIDAVGNQGNVIAKGKKGKKSDKVVNYYVSIDVELSSIGLTKIVIISPFYCITNKTGLALSASEDPKTANWVSLKEGINAFWSYATELKKLYFRTDGQPSEPMIISETNSSLLVIGGNVFDVHVEVKSDRVSIVLNNYWKGSAPIRIINMTQKAIEYRQLELEPQTLLPMHMVYFTWTNPSGERSFNVRSVGKKDKVTVEVTMDALGPAIDDTFYWASFLAGGQRYLLLTSNLDLATNALQADEITKPNTELELWFQGIGISLANNELRQEIVYIGITGSGIIWEVCKAKGKRFKPISVRQGEAIEAAYQKELLRRRVSSDLVMEQKDKKSKKQKQLSVSVMELAHGVKIDISNLDEIRILEPMKGLLRRSFAQGLWASFAMSEHFTQLQLRVNRVQIDNQTNACTFPIIMCPVSPPKSLAADRAPKAFVEISMLIQKQTNMTRIKFFKMLIQEFFIQIDGDFITSIGTFVDVKQAVNKNTNYPKLIASDLKYASEHEELELGLTEQTANYFDALHFSPIKVHVSFNLGGADSFSVLGVFDFLIRSAGVTLTEFKDVIFRIDCLEKKNVLLSVAELQSQVTNHYVRQVLAQFYVVVLGLDVIGNPVGLLLNLKTGVGNLFYEPYLGIIEGPEEFAEGLMLGVRSLVSSTVGGAAGALSRITGTISQGLSTLTMDEKDKRNRRERMNKPATVMSSSKNVFRGIWSGISGVVTKPFEGAQEDGFAGFARGLGRGVVGIVAQPATGVIDFASGTMSAVQRAIDINTEAKKQREARHWKKDGVLRPYNEHEAKGAMILHELDKGKYLDTDVYMSHVNLSSSVTILLTDMRLCHLKLGCALFKGCDADYTISYDNIASIELLKDGVQLKIGLKEQRSRLGGLIDGERERIINCHTKEAAEWLQQRLLAAVAQNP